MWSRINRQVTTLSVADCNVSPEIAPNSYDVNLGFAYDVKSAGNSFRPTTAKEDRSSKEALTVPTSLFPNLDRLRLLPERGPLTVLAVTLDLADSALRIEHPCLDFDTPDAHHLPPTTELLAELLLARFAELQTLVARYNAAADDAIDIRDPDDDIPF